MVRLRRFPALFSGPAWGPALVAGLGAVLPLTLGAVTQHAGFYWATLGALVAALANPLGRLGMAGLLLLILLGACSVALGYGVAVHPLACALLFAGAALALVYLQWAGGELAKLGFALALCLCFGQGRHGDGSFDNPAAIATLFLLGGLWVALLGFGLRGAHGLWMWQPLPDWTVLSRFARRQRRAQASRLWTAGVLVAALGGALAGFFASHVDWSQSPWLTLPVFLLINLRWQRGWQRPLLAGLSLLALLALLALLGYSLAGTPLMLLTALPLSMLCRLFQARPYGLFALQGALCLLLVSETLSPDWSDPRWRLLNTALGIAIALGILFAIRLAGRLPGLSHRVQAHPLD